MNPMIINAVWNEIPGKVADASFAPASIWELVKPRYPMAEIIPAINATLLLYSFLRNWGNDRKLCVLAILETFGIRRTALSQAPINPVKSNQLPDNLSL